MLHRNVGATKNVRMRWKKKTTLGYNLLFRRYIRFFAQNQTNLLPERQLGKVAKAVCQISGKSLGLVPKSPEAHSLSMF